jgi:hypothetical protein
MLDEKYSRAAFDLAGLDTEQAASLATSLQQDILLELDEVVRERFLQIVRRLNDMGHGLKPYTPLIPGELSFRDDSGEDGTESYRCLLRVAVDYVVSTGFAHLKYEAPQCPKSS